MRPETWIKIHSGIETKAIDLAFREMNRKAKLLDLAAAGLGLGPEQLRESLDPGYDLEDLRRRETPVVYGRTTISV